MRPTLRGSASTAVRRWVGGAIGAGGALRIGVLCAVQSAQAMCGVAFALALRAAVDGAASASMELFWSGFASMASLVAAQVVLRVVQRSVSERVRVRLENRLRGDAFRCVLGSGSAGSLHSGDVMTRMTSDAAVVAEGAVTSAPVAAAALVRVVGVFAVLAVLVPEIAVALVLVGLVGIAASTALRPRLKRLHAAMQEAEGAFRVLVQERLDALPVIHAFGREARSAAEAQRALEGYRAARVRKADASTAGSTLFAASMQAAYLAGFAWCGAGVAGGTCSVGTLMAVIQLTGQLQGPFTSLGGMMGRYASLLASAERLMALEDGFASAARPSRAVAPDSVRAIVLDDVAYGTERGEAVLSSCSLTVRRGEFIGIAGASGAGKSTLLRVLLGACSPTAGDARVLLDGGASIALEQVCGLFAYVPQGNRMMAGTVREAVAFADEGEAIDDARVAWALEQACASAFVADLPHGADTRLGQRGAGLSEGQLQRIALARALYSTAPVLVLDEATSALDAQTERAVMANLRALPDRWGVVVAHRPQALAACDRVVRLEDGTLVEFEMAADAEGGEAR